MNPLKILVISHNAFSKHSNNGKTLESIFYNFNKASISQLFFSYNKNLDFEYCSNYFQLTDWDVLKNTLFFTNKNGKKCINKYLETNNKKGKKRSANIFLKTFKIPLFRDLLWRLNGWKTNKLYNWIELYSPNLIFYVGGNFGFSHKIALHLSKKYKIPLVVYFTDDYLLHPIYKNIFEKIQHKRMYSFYKKTVQHASLCFGIGDLMCKEYTAYFGKSFYPLINIVKLNKLSFKSKTESSIKICYFGGLHLFRWKMISRLGKILNQTSLSLGIDIILQVYTTSEYTYKIKKSFEESSVYYMGAVYGREFQKKLEEADILLHVESDDKYYRSLTKLSVSTKIPEYLSTGKCIIAFGPSEVASIKLLKDHSIGYTLDSSEKDKIIISQLSTLLTDCQKQKEIGMRGYIYANKVFNADNIRNSFENLLNQIIK